MQKYRHSKSRDCFDPYLIESNICFPGFQLCSASQRQPIADMCDISSARCVDTLTCTLLEQWAAKLLNTFKSQVASSQQSQILVTGLFFFFFPDDPSCWRCTELLKNNLSLISISELYIQRTTFSKAGINYPYTPEEQERPHMNALSGE